MILQLAKIEDAFNVGGYLDTQTLDYIAPQWLHDSDPRYNIGFTNEQFMHVRHDSSRYLKFPMLRPAALRCAMALRLGISESDLAEAGIPKELYQEVMWRDDQDIDSAPLNYSDGELDMLSAVSTILMRTRKMDECNCMEHEFFVDMMCKWLAEYNIVLETV